MIGPTQELILAFLHDPPPPKTGFFTAREVAYALTPPITVDQARAALARLHEQGRLERYLVDERLGYAYRLRTSTPVTTHDHAPGEDTP
jgi:hypothetical protein